MDVVDQADIGGLEDQIALQQLRQLRRRKSGRQHRLTIEAIGAPDRDQLGEAAAAEISDRGLGREGDRFGRVGQVGGGGGVAEEDRQVLQGHASGREPLEHRRVEMELGLAGQRPHGLEGGVAQIAREVHGRFTQGRGQLDVENRELLIQQAAGRGRLERDRLNRTVQGGEQRLASKAGRGAERGERAGCGRSLAERGVIAGDRRQRRQLAGRDGRGAEVQRDRFDLAVVVGDLGAIGTGAGGAEGDVVEAEGLAAALAQGEQGIGQHRHGVDRHRKGPIGTGQVGRSNSGSIHLRTLIGGNL